MTKRQLVLGMRLAAALTALVLPLAAAGCSSSSAEDKTITIGQVEGWTDQTGTAALLQNILEKNGYNVEIKSVADNAPLYAAMANGDIDIMGSSWMERTQKSYWSEYSNDLEDLGTFYHGAKLYLAVPTYSDVHSIAQLPSHASDFGRQVVGIEPGAGLTEITKESVFPAYGLGQDYELVDSSTTAMLTELQKATEAKQETVVTLWRPFWANLAFPVRPLEDPKNAFGAAEDLHVVATEGFSEEHPEVANMIAHFQLSDQQYGTLEEMISNDFPEGREDLAAAAWLKKNPEYAKSLTKYLKG
jgi:glycine betaine/proline transport system substrate-binding protein